MKTNIISYEASTAVSIIDGIEPDHITVQHTTIKHTENNIQKKVILTLANRIVAQWTGEKWVMGSILEDILPIYKSSECIHSMNACTRLYNRVRDHKNSIYRKASKAHSLRIIRNTMDDLKKDSIRFYGSINSKWDKNICYDLIRKESKGGANVVSKKQMFQLIKIAKGKSNGPTIISKMDYGYGISLIGWIDINNNAVTIASSVDKYIETKSNIGYLGLPTDDVIRQICDFNNNKKRQ